MPYHDIYRDNPLKVEVYDTDALTILPAVIEAALGTGKTQYIMHDNCGALRMVESPKHVSRQVCRDWTLLAAVRPPAKRA